MRIIPGDPRILVEDGPALTGHWQPECSWCGVVFMVLKSGVFFCPICDQPRKSGELRPIDLNAEGTDE